MATKIEQSNMQVNVDLMKLLTEETHEMNPVVELKIHNFNVWFGSNHVIKNISFNILKNAVTAIIGPSGCGKSTLLKAINRMQDLVNSFHFSGEIRFRGKNVYDKGVDVTELRKKIGMVFQKPNPFPTSIRSNLTFGPRISRVPKSQWDDIVETTLQQTYLWDEVKDRLEDNAYTLSGGQQQRLCIARALSINPEVLLMDEPCSALDPIATSKIEELILELKQKYTVAIVTHSMAQARRVSDFTAFLYLGEVQEVDDTASFFNEPCCDRSRDYVTGKFG